MIPRGFDFETDAKNADDTRACVEAGEWAVVLNLQPIKK
jgi:hypothetical protein